MTATKSRITKFAVLFTALLAILFAVSLKATAAVSWPSSSNIKTYVLSTGNNTTVYQTASSTSKYGTIYASDLITINGWSGNRLKVTYPISGGTKTGYIEASAVLKKVNGATAMSTFTASKKIDVYRRPSGSATIGYIDRNDKVYLLYTQSGKAHVIYPISGGYKMGWIDVSDTKEEETKKANNAEYKSGSYIKVGGTTIYQAETFYTWNSNGTKKTTGGNYDAYPYVKVNGKLVNVASAQCMAYSRYIQELMYSCNDGTNANKFDKKYYKKSSHSTSELKTLITNAGSGANIRVGYSSSKPTGRHSIIVLDTDSNGFYYTDANAGGTGKVRVGYYTWQKLKDDYQNIYCVSVYKG